MNIENIIFDLGGVIVDFDDQEAINVLSRYGIKDTDLLINRLNDECIAYETGKIQTNKYFSLIANKLQCKNKHIELILSKAWKSIITGISYDKIEMLRKLKDRYRIFALSNTNESHVNAIRFYCHSNYNINNFFDLFEKAFFSYETGHVKPNKLAFSDFLEDVQVLPESTLVLDDRMENIEQARKLNFKTKHIYSEEVTKFLSQLL